MKITLLRHGKPDLPEWGKTYSSLMPKWIEAYNAAGVINESSLPCQTRVDQLKPDYIVCSTLQRSIHSAKIIGYSSPNLVDALFCEAELPAIKIPLLKLKPDDWSMIYRVFWFIGISPQVEPLSKFKHRVSLAAEKLIQLAEKQESVLLIGHGIMNRFLAKELLAKGWLGDEAPNSNKYYGYQYWEYASYIKNEFY